MSDLYCDHILTTPRDFDFGQGYAETWDVVQPNFGEWTTEQCRAFLNDQGYSVADDDELDVLRDKARETWDENQLGAPMMNYAYAIKVRGDVHEAADKLLDLPLTLVYFLDTEEYALALTGGGMDLSAEICKAYIALGQRPPVHFCSIPRMAGREYSQEFLATLIESCEIAQRWAQNTIDDLRSMKNEIYHNPAA